MRFLSPLLDFNRDPLFWKNHIVVEVLEDFGCQSVRSPAFHQIAPGEQIEQRV